MAIRLASTDLEFIGLIGLRVIGLGVLGCGFIGLRAHIGLRVYKPYKP